MNWPLFASIFSLIFIAELPDKTAFATLLMASKGKPFPIFVGVALAFLVQSIVAVAFGSVIGLFPVRWVHLVAGLLFIGFALYSWFEKEEAEEEENTESLAGKNRFLPVAWKAFVVIFIAEWGDLTQLATASLSARYHDSLLTVFLAATLSLWSVTALAVIAGNKLGKFMHAQLLKKIGAVLFAAVGCYFIFTWFQGN